MQSITQMAAQNKTMTTKTYQDSQVSMNLTAFKKVSQN